MRISTYRYILLGILIFAFQQIPAYGQQATINPLTIKPSNLIEDLKALKASNPNISAEDFVKSANEMLDKQGFNYAFVFDEKVCQQVEEVRKKQKDPNAPINLRGKLNSVAGEPANLVFSEVKNEKNECSCFVQIPVWEATERDFVTFIKNVNVKFLLPPNFLINEFALVDSKEPGAVIRRWKTPFRAVPLSISDDGKILFLPLPEKELSDLALIIFDEGVIQFYARKDIDKDKKGTTLKEFPKDAANPNLSYIQFEAGGIKQTVRFSAPCN
jgi:hypothetical protein